jgi:hypothetical protein|tara:strand:- start:2133 stop:2372 length:240 start_codon:yes stop_codon:yes gene_type:complete
MKQLQFETVIKKTGLETILDIGSGFVLAILTQIIIFPYFGYEVTMLKSIHLALIFTGISMLRSWCWRMYFNYKDVTTWF